MEQLPILLDGLVVGTVIIQSDLQAIDAAEIAAFDISSTNEVQLCLFCDGSYDHGRGGVALVGRTQWLPDAWRSGRTVTLPYWHFSEQAWPYSGATGSMVMEGIGILEGFHAANKIISRELPVLKEHNGMVTLKVTSDCVGMIRHVAYDTVLRPKAMRVAPPQLIKMIREEMQMLHGHGIKVTAELHWCPRNKVPQLSVADRLAYNSMKTGCGFSTADGKQWGRTIKSDMDLEIQEILAWKAPLPDKASEAEASDRPTAPPKAPAPSRDCMGKSRAARRRANKRAAREAANDTTTAAEDSAGHPQLSLPPIPPPTERGNIAPAAQITGSVTPPLEKPDLESPQDETVAKKPATAEGMKRKVEDEQDAKEPKKKAKLSHGKEGEETNNTAGETSSEGPPQRPLKEYSTSARCRLWLI